MRLLALMLCAAAVAGVGRGAEIDAAEVDPAQAEFFESRIRPLLVNRCLECHGPDEQSAGLRLDSQAAMLSGGDSGPALVPGAPADSLLMRAVGYAGKIQMPPTGKLGDQELADLTTWIELGAPWPADAPEGAAGDYQITPQQRAFWSFLPVQSPPAPAVRQGAWPRTEIDYFILAELERAGLAPVEEADGRTMIRRATFDLTGLPPTPQEVDAFLADAGTDAYERLIDRLLASPRYGERWGRHWLDVARYGEDQAHTFQARHYPHGYRYRDWVVRALNDDLPYDQFVLWQLAGDLLPEGDPRDRQIALGFMALGPVYYSDAGCADKAALDELDDRVDTLTRSLLGLTVACARCHDHKFDPIPQTDYYALAGVFSSTRYHEAPLVPDETVAAYRHGQAQIAEREQQIAQFLAAQQRQQSEALAADMARYLLAARQLTHPAADRPAEIGPLAQMEGLQEIILDRWRGFLTAEKRGEESPRFLAWFELDAAAAPNLLRDFAEGLQADVQQALARRDAGTLSTEGDIAAGPTEEDKQLLALLFENDGPCQMPADRVEGQLDGEGQQTLAALRTELERAQAAAPAMYPIAHALTEGEGADMALRVRGLPDKPGASVPRGFLSVLAEPQQRFRQGSGRLELARAIASRDNPLTARVLVNRVWQQHFGRGLIPTPDNLGVQGEPPTHPELLDHLASRFVQDGWSLKELHRRMMLSAVYRLSSDHHPQNEELDADNRLLWRMNRRRLDVEAWRDALLAVSGRLNLAVGGESGDLNAADYNRRTLYGMVSRHQLNSLLRLFDFPDPNIASPRRSLTTVPLQQLFVLNSDFMATQARSLAQRLLSGPAADDAARIETAFYLLYGRPPHEAERTLGLAFLAPAGEHAPDETSSLSRWEQYAQVLLAANEFAFVD